MLVEATGAASLDGSGNLTMTAKDFETKQDADANNTYVVEVTANDGANTTAKTITVTVNDLNDNAPVVTTGAAQAVNENSAFSVALTSTDAEPPCSTAAGAGTGAALDIAKQGSVERAADVNSWLRADDERSFGESAEPARVFATVQVGITLASFTSSAIAAALVAALLTLPSLADTIEESRGQTQLIVDGLDTEKRDYDALIGEARVLLQNLAAQTGAEEAAEHDEADAGHEADS